MTRVPIPAPWIPYSGPVSEPRLMAWYDRLQADRARVWRSNMVLAVEAGEVEADDLEALLALGEVDAADRERFRRQVRRLLRRAAR